MKKTKLNIDDVKIFLRKYFPLLIGIISLFLTYYYGVPFILGIISGFIFMSFIFLYPSPLIMSMFDKLFNFNKSWTVIKQNEYNKEKQRYEELKQKFKVKFNK